MNGDDPSADFKDSFAMQICVKCSMQKVLHRHSFGFGLGTQQGMIGGVIGRLLLVFAIFVCIILMLILLACCFGFSVLSSASLTDFTHLLVSSR